MKNFLPITSITIGLDVRDMEYGAGSGRFLHMKADAPVDPNGTVQGLNLEEALEQSIAMHFEAWKSVIVARYCGGKGGKAVESNAQIRSFEKRMDRIIKLIKEEPADEPQS